MLQYICFQKDRNDEANFLKRHFCGRSISFLLVFIGTVILFGIGTCFIYLSGLLMDVLFVGNKCDENYGYCIVSGLVFVFGGILMTILVAAFTWPIITIAFIYLLHKKMHIKFIFYTFIAILQLISALYLVPLVGSIFPSWSTGSCSFSSYENFMDCYTGGIAVTSISIAIEVVIILIVSAIYGIINCFIDTKKEMNQLNEINTENKIENNTKNNTENIELDV